MPGGDGSGSRGRFRLKIDNSATITSLIALALSLAVAIVQVKEWLTGAQIDVLAPRTILLVEDCLREPYVAFALELPYINRGARGFPGIITDATGTLELGAASWKFDQLEFVRVGKGRAEDASLNQCGDVRTLPGLRIERDLDGRFPVVVPGRSVAIAQLLFHASVEGCDEEYSSCPSDLKVDDLADALERDGGTLSVRIATSTFSDGDEEFSCRVALADPHLSRLRNERSTTTQLLDCVGAVHR